MPILFGESAVTDAQLDEMLEDFRSGLTGRIDLADTLAADGKDPLSFLTARDLAGELVRLIDLARAPGAVRELKIRAVNVAYEGFLAVVDLVKTHSGGPTVPAARKPRDG